MAMRRTGIDNPNDYERLLGEWWPVENRKTFTDKFLDTAIKMDASKVNE